MHPSATSSSQPAGRSHPVTRRHCLPSSYHPRLIDNPLPARASFYIQLIPLFLLCFVPPTSHNPLPPTKCPFNRHLSKSLSTPLNSHAFTNRPPPPRVVSFPWPTYYPTMRLHNTSLNPLTFPKSTNNPPCHLRGHRQQFVENTPRLQTTNEDACPIIPRGWVERNITPQGAVRLHLTNSRGRVDKAEKTKRKGKHKGRNA